MLWAGKLSPRTMLLIVTGGAGEQGPAGGREAEATERQGGPAGGQRGGKEAGARWGDKEEAGGTEAGRDGAAGDGETATPDGGEERPGTAGPTEVWYPQQPLSSGFNNCLYQK